MIIDVYCKFRGIIRTMMFYSSRWEPKTNLDLFFTLLASQT